MELQSLPWPVSMTSCGLAKAMRALPTVSATGVPLPFSQPWMSCMSSGVRRMWSRASIDQSEILIGVPQFTGALQWLCHSGAPPTLM